MIAISFRSLIERKHEIPSIPCGAAISHSSWENVVFLNCDSASRNVSLRESSSPQCCAGSSCFKHRGHLKHTRPSESSNGPVTKTELPAQLGAVCDTTLPRSITSSKEMDLWVQWRNECDESSRVVRPEASEDETAQSSTSQRHMRTAQNGKLGIVCRSIASPHPRHFLE